MPSFGQNCDGIVALTLIANWLVAFAYIYFISVSYEYYTQAREDDDLVKADAEYTERRKKEDAEKEIEREE